MKKSSALVILSGGQDSTTCLFWAKEWFDEVHAVTFNYGQRHKLELLAAEKVAAMAGVVSHEIVNFPDILRSTSPLTAKGAELETYVDHEEMEKVIGDRVELTFVPMRNSLFFVVAMNRAVALGVNHLVTGICQEDNANYPDCTEVFRSAFETMANTSLGTLDDERKYTLYAPLMNLSKPETVRLARNLPGCWDALAYTHTNYDGTYPPVSKDHANVLRAWGFERAGFPDPLVMRAHQEGLMPLPTTSNYDSVRNG